MKIHPKFSERFLFLAHLPGRSPGNSGSWAGRIAKVKTESQEWAGKGDLEGGRALDRLLAGYGLISNEGGRLGASATVSVAY